MTDDILSYQQAVIDQIKATLDKERNFENVALPFAIRESNGGAVEMVITFYESVSTNATVRAIASKARAKFDLFENTVFGCNELY